MLTNNMDTTRRVAVQVDLSFCFLEQTFYNKRIKE